ncbi:4-diphosphocytidyl-2-c-methyl-d-erythritol kinase [Plakobranchus ocellatus]|uniref:4-diphosphocytidyl-2-c-methyl-d-erythritol kinase n=1 Tax=Plakobranchus ocellatus TaxID=259542 RepID=A0AAV3ZCX6_9GAST|nr:4-diphosphocytidyl-2-c-methyl-d-erythritol kinase [Plakobranchus ocellatus]
MPPEVSSIYLFCDPCPGQNKNWTMLWILHYFIHQKKRFRYVHLTFPIRRHSYMECDRDMVLINQKLTIETPSGWHEHFEDARKTHSPFNVITVDSRMLLDVEQHIKNVYVVTCPVKTQPLREVIFCVDPPRLMQYREAGMAHLAAHS